MGGGSWSTQTYQATTARNIASGSNFGYYKQAQASGIHKVHDLLDPKKVNAAGLNIREARDSVEHPNSTPITVLLDTTASMGHVPGVVQKSLAGLFGLLLRKGYCQDPQLNYMFYGDTRTDTVPFQASQYESSNVGDEALNNALLSSGGGCGGGNGGETPTIAWYYMNTHVVTDAWEKRGKKGYLFMIADECAADISAADVSKYIGDGEPLGELTVEGAAKALNEKWEVIVLLVDNLSARSQRSFEKYSALFGKKNVLVLEDANNVAEIIGAAIGVMENEDLDIDELEDDLVDVGATRAIAGQTVKTVARLGEGRRGGAVVASGAVDLDI